MKYLSSRWMKGFLANIWCTSGKCPGATTLPNPHWNMMNYLNKSLDMDLSGPKLQGLFLKFYLSSLEVCVFFGKTRKICDCMI